MNIVEFKPDITHQNLQGLIELDFDPAAERYLILDRMTGIKIWNGPVPDTNPAKLIVPFKYTIGNNLIVMIIDDSGDPAYNAAVNDKVQAQIVNARLVTTNP